MAGSVQRFRAAGYRLGRAPISCRHLVERPAQSLLEFRGGIEAHEDFLGPETKLGSLQIGLQRFFPLAAIAVALRQVELIPRPHERIALRLQCGLQDFRVAPIGLGISPSGAIMMASEPQAFEYAAATSLFAGQEFMQYAPPSPWQGSPDDLRSVIGDGGVSDPKHVRVGLERGHFELGLELEHIIGVDDQHVFAMRSRKLQCLGSIMSEVAPGPLVQLSRQIGQQCADFVLGAVGRAGVDDHPIVYQWSQ